MSSIKVSRVANSQYFGTLLTRLNQIADYISGQLVTIDTSAGGSISTGNVAVNGHFTANAMATPSLRGGNNTVSAPLVISSNVVIEDYYGVNTVSFTTNGASSHLAVNASVSFSNTVTVGNDSVNVYTNSTAFTGTSNNSLYLGGTAAAGYQTTAGLSSNVSHLTANNATHVFGATEGNFAANNAAYLGGVVASGYQTTAGLAANVATMSANNAAYLGGTAAAGYQTTAGLAANVATMSANNAGYLGGVAAANYILNTGGVVAGNLSFTGLLTMQQVISAGSKVSATAASGTVDFDTLDGSAIYYTTNAAGNWILNVRGNNSTSLDTMMSANQSISIVTAISQGATPYYNNSFKIDGSTVTPKWQGGTPITGSANGVDVYSYTIFKTGSAAFQVLALQTQFKV